MNERNVEALADLLQRAAIKPGEAAENGEAIRQVARWLASEGVLVPSALTDEQCDQIATDEVDYKVVRDLLERIAKGEADA